MRDYPDNLTIERQLQAYMESEDLELDISYLENEYHLDGVEIPSREQLRAEAIQDRRKWLENTAACEREGHCLTEIADGENGTSELSCDRCGFSQHIQW